MFNQPKNLINVIILTSNVWEKRINYVHVLEKRKTSVHRCWDFSIEAKVREKIEDVLEIYGSTKWCVYIIVYVIYI